MSAKSAAAVSAPRIQETNIWQAPKETEGRMQVENTED